MNSTAGRRAGQFPGKMQGGVKLIDCVHEMRSIFKMTPITDRDRKTLAFAGLTSLAASRPFYNPSDREPWVAECYLGDAARDAVIAAMVSGSMPIWLYYVDEFIELVPEMMFGRNKWRSAHTVNSGKYSALNVDHYDDRDIRRECDGATLWVNAAQWSLSREQLIESRARCYGSELNPDFRALIDGTIAPEWSLIEAVAWLLTDDLNFVAQQSIRYAGHPDPKIAGRVTWLRLEDDAKARAPADQTISAAGASDVLRAACEQGAIAVSGVVLGQPTALNSVRSIPRGAFRSAELGPNRGGALYPIVNGIAGPPTWIDLRFKAEDVRAVTQPDADRSASVVAASSSPALPSLNLGPPIALKRPIQRWSGEEMTLAIRQWTGASASHDRDAAWRDHFKALVAEHGWDNRGFRAHWAKALGSEGKPGRRQKSAR